MTPHRIQRKREKGWRMPENSVYISPFGQWANTHAIFDCWCDCDFHRTAFDSVNAFRQEALANPDYVETAKRELRGKNLACWCELCEKHKDGKPLGVDCPDCAPCHVDVLLELANPEGGAE